MNIYLVEQDEASDYDTFDSMVVAAPDTVTARRTSPSGVYEWSDENNCWMYCFYDGRRAKERRNDWANSLERIRVKFLGIAEKGVEQGVILASFNAG